MHETRLIYVPVAYRYVQAEHRHAAGLINLLFKGHIIYFYKCFATQAGG